jgi:hypothetical protein
METCHNIVHIRSVGAGYPDGISLFKRLRCSRKPTFRLVPVLVTSPCAVPSIIYRGCNRCASLCSPMALLNASCMLREEVSTSIAAWNSAFRIGFSSLYPVLSPYHATADICLLREEAHMSGMT